MYDDQRNAHRSWKAGRSKEEHTQENMFILDKKNTSHMHKLKRKCTHEKRKKRINKGSAILQDFFLKP